MSKKMKYGYILLIILFLVSHLFVQKNEKKKIRIESSGFVPDEKVNNYALIGFLFKIYIIT
ncbi:MAG TPA: hypothetical protein VK982_09050 [Bacteroidales bacterium]|nr:hypothetical protein [Bacteroidales bacterium]